MSAGIFSVKRAERFAKLLDEAAGGPRHHARSRADDEITPLVSIAHRVRATRPRVDVDPEFRAGLRAMLIATAEREGIGVTATAPEPTFPSLHGSGRRKATSARRARARVAVIVGVAAGTLTLGGMSAASGDAMPGDPLYGIKRSTERAQLALAGTDVSRGQLYLEFAKTRVGEARAVNSDAASLVGVLTDMDEETRHGVRLLTGASVSRRDPVALDAVDRFVETQRRSVAGLLDHQRVGGRDRVLESLTLLDQVTRRTTALRPALTCGTAGNDAFGPIPDTCGTAAPAVGIPATAQTGGTSGRDQTPAPATAATAPDGDSAGNKSPAAPSGPTGAPAEAPESSEGGLLADLGRFLGGLLG